MALLSNSLYLDNEYKADCEFKINYLYLLDSESDNDPLESVDTPDERPQDGKQDLLESLVTRLNKDRTGYTNDGGKLYKNKQISNDYCKILFELEQNNQQIEQNEEN